MLGELLEYLPKTVNFNGGPVESRTRVPIPQASRDPSKRTQQAQTTRHLTGAIFHIYFLSDHISLRDRDAYSDITTFSIMVATSEKCITRRKYFKSPQGL